MKILVLYGTTEGQTRKVAEYIAGALQDDDVMLVDAVDAPRDLDLASFDAAILAGSLHAHHYQHPLIAFARHHRDRLNQIRSLFVSVSLTAAGHDPDDREGLATCAEAFVADTGWTPGQILHVAGAFRFTEYDFFKGWVMRLIAKEKKVEVDPHRDLELTDWPALTKDIKAFRAGVETPINPSTVRSR